jgi:signal transduction histidine kinase
MNKFEFFKKFRDAVVIVSSNAGKNDVIYRNNTFKRYFEDFTDLKKFSHNMNFDICPLNSDDIGVYSPLFHALNSKEDFVSHISYQGERVLYFDMTAIKRKRYTVIVLHDTTGAVTSNDLKKQNDKIKEDYALLAQENEDLQKIRQKAQSQAIRIALINNVSNIIRESIDISQILQSTLRELATMFGAYKAYYASQTPNTPDTPNTPVSAVFTVAEVCGGKKNSAAEKISFDENTHNIIARKEIQVSNCLIEYSGAKPFEQPVLRVIVPVHHAGNLMGIIVLLSRQRRELNEEIEILEAISSQLSNAISRAQLYQKNIQTVNELQKALEELKETQLQLINSEKMASLGQLVAGVAHEINTPVASIKSNNAITQKLLPQLKDEETAEILRDINSIDFEAIQRISNMVTSLKKFVRLDEAELQEADINKELDLTLDLIRHETKNRIEIEKDYGEIPAIRCFPNMLNQVFTNILINACQAIDDRGTIKITTRAKGEKVTIKIKDTGRGMPQDTLNKIFTAGFTTKSAGVGTGLGLAICTKIIEKHNGEIIANSELGGGSEFIITIHSK